MRRTLPLLLLLTALPAAGQTPRRFELTPLVGYRLAGELDAVDEEFGRSDVELDESASYGFAFDIPLNPGFQLELMARRQETSFVADEGILDPGEELGDVEITQAHAGLLFQWGPGQVNGFVVLSGGISAIDPEGEDLDSETRLSGSLGGGVKVFFNRNVGLRLEGRGYWTDFAADEDDDDFRRRRRTYDDALVQGEGSVGLIVAW
ncbi:MAG TPA: outer membrane beta-barrel protein [Thermoanaerobaculia bacterium]|nr:outer membrane beta-barrel protein [Thermoanaerobaculia bacterium]